ncbi:adenosylcobinamide-GDP ribazoletransferase [Roseomonas elaeocarpi]|uniref:Adenosylcobinamide-GDP ribazoletransferase n=1 Tax=Roseomonas elaeocarpi TaxID=907779 RepID=A0ABV6JUE9_9PROT
MTPLRRRGAELVLAAMVLTRLPVARWAPREMLPLGGTVWAFPLVGAAVGAIGGLGYGLGCAAGLPTVLSAGWTLVGLLMLTGGLHEDGLADTADGFGGGRTVARKLEIMRDSRIGSYGVLALILSLGLRGAALVSLREPTLVLAALVAAGALGRGAILVLLRLEGAARPDGLAAALGRPGAGVTATGLLLAGLSCLALPPMAAALSSVAAVGCAVAVGRMARRQVGGHTGDVLGAAEQVTEAVVLSLLAAMLAR